MLRNNTFCMGSVESLKSLIAELPEGVEAIEREIAGSEKDVKEKRLKFFLPLSTTDILK